MESARSSSAAHFTDDYLAHLLARASLLVSQQFHAQLAAAGVRVPEWRVLATLSDRPTLTIGQLAEFTLLKQPTLTRVVDRMEESGWVTRQAEARDRRVTHVRIAPAGQQVVSRLLAQAKAHEALVVQGYSETGVKTIKAGLRELIARCGGGN